MDVAYITMAGGFVYLAVVLDWFSRRVFRWKLSTTMDIHCCLGVVEEEIGNHEKPEMMNTEKGSEFNARILGPH